MAFHPFKHFRKRQKVYLAILTVFTMIIFVAQFGAGDPFTRLQQWIGMTVHHSDPVLELYGKKVYSEDIDKLRKQRQLAHEFMIFGSFGTPLQKSLMSIEKKFAPKKDSNELPNVVQSALQQMRQVTSSLTFAPPEQKMPLLQMTLGQIQRQLGLPEIQKNADQYRALDTMATNLALMSWASDPARQRGDSYFGGSTRTEDLLDFMVWKQQADRLGITLTQADVLREINRAWGNEDFLQTDEKLDSNIYVAEFFRVNSRIHKSLTARDLLSALTDEFRVALAREAILGSSSGLGTAASVRSFREAVDGIHYSPSVATPDEFYEYFREQRTTLSVSMLAIPVENFVKQVTAKPSESDLKNLFERYKNDEPSSSRRQPGFKEPRRIRVQYFSYRPEGAFARKLAAKQTELLPVFRVLQPAMPYPAGGGFLWAANLAFSGDLDTALRNEYESYRSTETARVVKHDRDDGLVTQSVFRFGQGVPWSDGKAAQVQAPAALTGQLLGSLATGGSPLSGPISYAATDELYGRATLTAFASTVLAASSASPLVAVTLPMRYVHTVQPFEAVRDKMLDRFQTTLARHAMESTIAEVKKEIEKLITARDDDKLDAYLKRIVAEYGLENFHSMTTDQTRQEIQDRPDPALKVLREAYDESLDNPFMGFGMGQQRPDFVSALFDLSPFERQFRMDRPERFRQFRSRSGDVTWLFWRAEDKPAHTRRFEEVRGEVKDAWLLEQARRLARARANEINEALQKRQDDNPDAAVRFLIEQNVGRVFQLDNVAQLAAPVFNLPNMKFSPTDYHDYVPPKEEIPYPPPDLVAQLLKLKKRGQSRVIADQPVRHFYVAVLRENPQPPERREFFEVYNTRGDENKVWNAMMQSRRRQYEQKLIEQLRAEATKSLEGGEYILPDNLRGRGESSSDSGE
jgi:hypothetical protein